MKSKDIVHEYFKRVFEDTTVIVKLNPIDFTGTEMIVHPDGKLELTEMSFDEDIYEDFQEDEFQKTNPFEFNLHLNKLL